MQQLDIRISTPQEEGKLQVSKWLKYQALLDSAEMKELLLFLEPFSIFVVSEAVEGKSGLIEKTDFIAHHQRYIEELKKGELPDESQLRKYFSSIFTTTSDLLYAMKLSNGKSLIKPLRPVIQLQLHHFFASSLDGKFYPMVLSDESVTWGIQFSYPQLFQDPKTFEITKVTSSPEFPNTALFLKLVKWMRTHTVPTPFLFQDKKTNAPMRIGRNCFDWIEKHPGLILRGIKVIKYGS